MPQLSSKNYILVDASTGIVLAAKGEHERRPVASLTKIMTALIVLGESTPMDAVITASKKASSAGESEIYLEPGDKLQVRSLLYALMLKSANDAAVALSEGTAGRTEIFVALMNKKAREIGALNTSFKNPHGLDQPGHYSTAYDVALISRYALSYPFFRKLVSTREATITWQNSSRTFKLYNHNKLLFRNANVKGIKTGFTLKAGHCLASYAEKDGKRLLAVVLNAQSPYACYDDSLKLLDYGFKTLRPVKIVAEEMSVPEEKLLNTGRISLKASGNLTVFLPENYNPSLLNYSFIEFEQDRHESPGILKVFYDGRLIGITQAEAVRKSL